MEQVKVGLRNGRSVPFEVEFGLEGPAYFVFGVRKSGSTLLNLITTSLARLNDRRIVAVGDTFFNHNVPAIDWQYDPALPAIIHPGNVYVGCRDMPFALLGTPLFDQSPKVLIVRDPRDALVSEFFSNAYSHTIPKPSGESSAVTDVLERERNSALTTGIDAYVLQRSQEMVRTILEFGAIAKSPTTKLVKYENYIFKKRDLVELVAHQFGWTVDESAMVDILRQFDVRPAAEDPHAFIRKVTPGDHREKLQSSTVAKLNTFVRRAMRLLDYPEQP
jgi:hypothetical protein